MLVCFRYGGPPGANKWLFTAQLPHEQLHRRPRNYQVTWQPSLKFYPEAESKEKLCVWDPMPELTITSPYVHTRVDSNTFTMDKPMPESSLTLFQSRLYSPVRDFRFGVWAPVLRIRIRDPGLGAF